MKSIKTNTFTVLFTVIFLIGIISACQDNNNNNNDDDDPPQTGVDTLNLIHNKTIDFGGQRAHGITFDGDFLWVADAGHLKRIDSATGSILEEIQVSGVSLTGLTWDFNKSVFYYTEDVPLEEPDLRIVEVDTLGNETTLLIAPGEDATGLANDDDFIYHTGFGSFFFKIPKNNPSEYLQYDVTNPYYEGATVVGNDLFVISIFEKKLLRFDKNTMTLNGVGDLMGEHCLGLTFDGKYFWVTDAEVNGIEKSVIHKFEIQ